jgi:hypothetical protein
MLLQNVSMLGNNDKMYARINDSLDLCRRSSSDVGDGPARFLPDAILRRGQKAEESGKCSRGDNNLGLKVVTSNNVSDRSQSGGLDRGGRVPEVRFAVVHTHIKRSTNRLQTPLSITAWILSLLPSDRYEIAQHASMRTSSSSE